MRGAAPSARCPRCDAEQPPGAERFVTCAACGLRYDESAPHAQRARERDAGAEPPPPGVAVVDDAVVLPRELWFGLAWSVVSVALIGASMYKLVAGPPTWGEKVMWGVLALAGVFTIRASVMTLVGRMRITFAPSDLRVELAPFATTYTSVSRASIARVSVVHVRKASGESRGFAIIAHTTDRGELTLVRVDREPVARFVQRTIEARLDLPPEPT